MVIWRATAACVRSEPSMVALSGRFRLVSYLRGSEGASETVHERVRDRAIGIEEWVEDGHLYPYDMAATERCCQRGLEFVPLKSAREAVIDGRQ